MNLRKPTSKEVLIGSGLFVGGALARPLIERGVVATYQGGKKAIGWVGGLFKKKDDGEVKKKEKAS